MPTVTVRSLTEEIGKWEELYKKYLNDPDNHDGYLEPRARHPGMWSQVGLRKHHYEQS